MASTSNTHVAAEEAAETTEPHSTNAEKTISLSDLQNSTISPTLWYKIHVFFDLRHYSERADSEARLEQVSDPSYIGLPYFEPEEAEAIKNTAIDENKTLSRLIEETLEERLNRRMKKRVSSGDLRVCAAHDIAPVLEKALGIDPKRLSKDECFLDLLNTASLKLGDRKWDGLQKKSFAPKDKKKGKGKHR